MEINCLNNWRRKKKWAQEKKEINRKRKRCKERFFKIQRKKRGIIDISLENQELKTNVRDKCIGKERWRVRKRCVKKHINTKVEKMTNLD